MAHTPDGNETCLTLLQERSSGTFARVYLAEARDSRGEARTVAVKVLKEQWQESDELIRRTRDEALLLARLQHENILRVEAMTEIAGNTAIVMEFVNGVDLGQLIESTDGRLTAFPPRTAYSIAHKTAEALHAAWSRIAEADGTPMRVVHRDIKPPNIMISVTGEVKVLDFGTARFTHELRAAKTGVMRFGSMKYMSPERRNGERGQHSSDVYSLGLVLIEMLRGEMLPLLPVDEGAHDSQISEIIADLDNIGLPDDAWIDSLRQTLSSMCASDPKDRISAAQVIDLMKAFTEASEGQPLAGFASSRVTEVTRQKYGNDDPGELTGSQIFVLLESPASPRDQANETSSESGALLSGPLAEPPLSTEQSPSASHRFPRPTKRFWLTLAPLIAMVAALLFLANSRRSTPTERSDDDDDSVETRNDERTASVDWVPVSVHVEPPESGIRFIQLRHRDTDQPYLHTGEASHTSEPTHLAGEVPEGDYLLMLRLGDGTQLSTLIAAATSVEIDCNPTEDAPDSLECRDIIDGSLPLDSP